MKFFAYTCHQEPQKSFFIKKYQMPICARCLGMYIGYLIGIIVSACLYFFSFSIIGIFLLIMLIDWLNQNVYNIYKSNLIRFLSGISGGIGIIFLIANFIIFFL